MSHDLIILGAGPAGYVAAERAGALGRKVLLVEREEHLGGVCLNWGCIPTKTLLASAKAYYGAIHGEAYGVTVEKAVFHLDKAMARKAAVQTQLRTGIRGLMRKFKVEVVRGQATVLGAGRVAVAGVEHRGGAILVATGSRPARPPIPGIELAHVVDSSGILGIASLPKRLAIVGGGVIGVEFACFFASVGVEVTVIEFLTEITPSIDGEVAGLLRRELEAKGVRFHLGHKVARIDAAAVHHVDQAGATHDTAADLVLVCTGRLPNSDGLGLEQAGVDIRRGAIQVDERMRTNVPGIWAAGDVTARSMLAHVASRQAEVAVNNLFGSADRMRYHAIPGVIYTSPEVAAVGLSEAQARAEGIPVAGGTWNLAANGRFLAESTGKGMLKAVLHAETRQLLGVAAIGPAVSEMAAGWAAAIEAEFRVQEMAELVFPHPTVSEALRDAVLHASFTSGSPEVRKSGSPAVAGA
jgi:dihydrolipoamide dehydrogenase